jgi:hypothetical protein
MILYIKDPRNNTQKLIDTINSFSNVAGCKINLQKSVDFLYRTMNKLRIIYKNNFIYQSIKKIKYLGVNLTKDMNDLYEEN